MSAGKRAEEVSRRPGFGALAKWLWPWTVLAYALILAVSARWLLFPRPDLWPELAAIWLAAGASLAFVDRLPPRARQVTAPLRWVAYLGATLILAFSLFLGTAIVALFSGLGLVAMVSVAVVALAARTVAWTRIPALRPVLRLVVATCVLLEGTAWLVAVTWLWHPPSSHEWQVESARQPIQRISPLSWMSTGSQPYKILILPQERLLLASFKSASNQMTPFWRNPQGNRLAVYSLDRPSAGPLSVTALGAEKLPESFAYDAARHQVWVTLVGRGRRGSDIAVFRLTRRHRLRLVDKVSTPEVNNLVYDVSRDQMFAFGQEGRYGVFSASNPRAVRWIDLRPRKGVAVNILDGVHAPGSRYAYLAFAGTLVGAFDLETRRLFTQHVYFGAGCLTTAPQVGLLLQTDIVRNAVHLYRLTDLDPVRTVPVGFIPRPITADVLGQRVFVGGAWDGGVRTYSLPSMTRVGRPIFVGRYLRALAFDPTSGAVYAASKAGLIRIPASALPVLAPVTDAGGAPKH